MTPDAPDAPRNRQRDGRDVVALILALGLAIALVVLTVGLVLVSTTNAGNVFPIQGAGGIPENTTQILTLVFGGVIGVLGSYIGAGDKRNRDGKGGGHGLDSSS